MQRLARFSLGVLHTLAEEYMTRLYEVFAAARGLLEVSATWDSLFSGSFFFSAVLTTFRVPVVQKRSRSAGRTRVDRFGSTGEQQRRSGILVMLDAPIGSGKRHTTSRGV